MPLMVKRRADDEGFNCRVTKPADTKALFIPTAAIDAEAIEVLPKCMNDLLKCGILKEKREGNH